MGRSATCWNQPTVWREGAVFLASVVNESAQQQHDHDRQLTRSSIEQGDFSLCRRAVGMALLM
jgi:hypothetical protein